ncbi:MAG: 30S ribosomal protein S20 [Deltaproteobacteria bacterium]|nr:30S ribosomal protein S20 [Deltaproteobacteria bacterium]
MANHRQAIKRNKQRIQRQAHNRHYRTTMRTHVKRLRAAIEGADQDAATSALVAVVPVIDRCAQKGVIPHRRASRLVSRLTLAVQRMPQA